MGQQQSKDELLYQQVNYGNSEGIKALRTQGAGLEWIDRDGKTLIVACMDPEVYNAAKTLIELDANWIDREGKTPLIVACMNPELYNVAKTLIELGANVNAYRPGCHAGTPLHHAAKRGLEPTVKLLLSHGANPLVMNDDCQTPLDLARNKGYSNVVRAIESHICLFSGWLRELCGPSFLERFAPQLLSRKVWVVVLPIGSRNLQKPFKLELAIYGGSQDAQPRTIISLWKANMEEPKFNQPDPAVIISDNHTKTRVKLAAANESDKQQLQWFCNACKGIAQIHPAFPFNAQASSPATAPPAAENVELDMAISASLQTAVQEAPPALGSTASTSWTNPVEVTNHTVSLPGPSAPSKGSSIDWEVNEAGPSGNASQNMHIPSSNYVAQITHENSVPASSPSAPPFSDAVIDDGPINYPSIDMSPVDLSSQPVEILPLRTNEKKEDTGASSSCVICLDAPIEGACIPCGHMAGCMTCLNEIKAKKWGCPVCRAKIDQVVRLYAV